MSISVKSLSACFAAVLFLVACSSKNEEATGDAAHGEGGLPGADGSAGSSGGTSGDGGARSETGAWNPAGDSSIVKVQEGGVPIPVPDGGTVMCYRISCNEKILECGDCEDDDGDGLIDSFDPECLGPCDNTEGTALYPGIGGETGEQCKRDCYFDYGNGPGNDDCHWAYVCDPLAPKEGCEYDQSWVGGSDCPNGQSQQCLNLCLPITPNGCDCFGCCTFPELAGKGEGGKDKYVFIGRTDEPFCTLKTVTDPAGCPPCIPEPSCTNACGRCEICIGKPTIPADCLTPAPDGGAQQPDGGVAHPDGGVGRPDGGPPSTRCAAGIQPCGLPGDSPCGPGHYCITGCCIPIII